MTAKNLAQAHAGYLVETLLTHDLNLPDTQEKLVHLIAYHYRSAFIHGYKHGAEDGQVSA